jgi:hypothetical protein
LLLCSSYLPLGVPNWADIYTPSTFYYIREPNSIGLPRKFTEVVDKTTKQVLLRVRRGATGY